MTSRDEVLDHAKTLINGDRAKDYGEALANHQRIADGWNVIVGAALHKHGRLLPAHVALMMDWVKSSRLLETIDHPDSWVDKAAYSALGGEFGSREISGEP
jgi:hypothetical protein